MMAIIIITTIIIKRLKGIVLDELKSDENNVA